MSWLPKLTQDAFFSVGDDMQAHLLVLYTLARHIPARLAIEIGTDDGSSTLALAAGVAHCGGMLHSIDPAPCEAAHARIEGAGLSSVWRHYRVRSNEYESTVADLVFIDGDHSYEGVFSDFDKHGSIVSDGGFCVFHDSNTNEFPGVAEVVNQIKSRGGFEVLTLPWCFGLTICRRIA